MISTRSIFAAAILSSVSLLIFSGLSVFAAGKGDAECQQGIQLYGQKKYREALLKFMAATHENPENTVALLYLGNCAYYIGEKAQAIKAYQILHENFPSTPAGRQAALWLQQAGLLKQPQTNAGKASKPTSGNSARQQVSGATGRTGGLVLIVPPRAGRPAVTPSKINFLVGAMNALPNPIKQCLVTNGVKIFITPTVEDFEPGCKYQEASGYEGATFKSCPAFYVNGKVVVAERTLDEDDESVSPPIDENEMRNALYHELGHALDSCLENLSETNEFRHVYWQDKAKLEQDDADSAHRLRYYLQQSRRGQRECCAELVGGMLGLQSDENRRLRAAFPLTAKFLKDKLEL